MKFDARHPWYKENVAQWHFIRAAVAGDNVERFLKQAPLETRSEFQDRSTLATRLYRNYPSMTTNLWTSILFKKAPARTLPRKLADLTANVDRTGTDATPFFQRVAQDALSYGVNFVLVDLPTISNGDAPKTEAERLARGISPYFVTRSPLEVLDWSLDDQGRLLWVALADQWASGEAKPFEEKPTQEAVLVIEPDSWTRWIEVKGQLEPVESGTNHFGEVALVPFYSPGKLAPMQATSPLKPICDLSLELLQVNSLLATALGLFGIPRLSIATRQDPGTTKFTPTNALALLPGEGAEFLAMPAHAIKGLLDAASQLKRDIRDHMHRCLDMRLESAAGETAEKVKLDNEHLRAFLASFANSMQEGELRCWQLAAKALRLSPDAVSITYEQRLDARPAQDRLEEALRVNALDLPSPTFRATYQAQLVQSLLEDAPPEIIQAAVQELEQAEGA